MREFIRTAILELGTSACPPYHLAVVIGGTSAELTMKTVKAASIKALDGLPTQGNALGHAWRDLEWEAATEEVGVPVVDLGMVMARPRRGFTTTARMTPE